MYNPELSVSRQDSTIELEHPRLAIISPELLQLIDACPHGEPLTYGATPLDYLQTLEQQAAVRTSLIKMTYSCPGDIPMEIASHVHTVFGHRITGREQANNDNYVTSLMYERQDEIDPVVLTMVRKAELGQACPAELILVRDVMGIRSVELACLTHPYGGERIKELLPPMRDAVEYAIAVYDGEYIKEQESIYAIKDAVKEFDTDPDDLSSGVIMTRKRIVGSLPDGTIVKERSSFVLRTDKESLLPEALRTHIASLDLSNPTWKQQMLDIEGMREYVAYLLDEDKHTQAIPVSTTIYAFNKDTAEKVAAHTEVVNQARFEERRLQKERMKALIEESKLEEEKRKAAKEEIAKIIKDLPYFNNGRAVAPFNLSDSSES